MSIYWISTCLIHLFIDFSLIWIYMYLVLIKLLLKYYRIDTSVGGLLDPDCIIRPVVCISTRTDMNYEIYLLLKITAPRYCYCHGNILVILFRTFDFLAPKEIQIICHSNNFTLVRHRINVIPGMRRVH